MNDFLKQHTFLIKEFLKCKRIDTHIKFAKEAKDLRDAIIKSVRSLDVNGKKNSHQKYRSKEEFDNIEMLLLKNETKISKCKEFHDIMVLFWELKTKGFGPLTRYDAATSMVLPIVRTEKRYY